MSKSSVAAVICENYDEEKVYEAVSVGLEALGGIASFCMPEEKILVKPNFLHAADADKAVTTHPSVMKAVLRILSESGYKKVLLGDSPAVGSCIAAAQKLGLDEKSMYGAGFAEMKEAVDFVYPEGKACNRFHLAKEALDADAIIGICKMKTHALERITGAVKNMYGLIAGYEKAAGHVNYPTAVSFARMTAEIHLVTPQRLHIMDGITAMEGNGPSAGNPVHMGILLFSCDPVALDTVFCRLIYLDPALVPTNTQGELAGIGCSREDNIDVILARKNGQEIITAKELARRYGKADFDVQREKDKLSVLSLWNRICGGKRHPVIDDTKCTRCGLCAEHCPVEGKAVSFKNGKEKAPVFDYSKCIRCYCCQEICPASAISKK